MKLLVNHADTIHSSSEKDIDVKMAQPLETLKSIFVAFAFPNPTFVNASKDDTTFPWLMRFPIIIPEFAQLSTTVLLAAEAWEVQNYVNL